MSTTTLSCLPHFTFYQDHNIDTEQPIHVTYYNGSIELEQLGNMVMLHPDSVRHLFKAILKNQEEANAMISKH